MKTLFTAALTVVCAFPLAAQTFELRPGASGVKDTYIWQDANFSHGTWGELYGLRELPEYGIGESKILIQFLDFSSVTSSVEFASLNLYRYDADISGSPLQLDVVRIMSDWQEEATFSSTPTLSQTTLASLTVSGTNNGWYEWDITSAMQDWLANPATNFGVAIVASGEGYYQRFVSSDNLDASQPSSILPPKDPLLQPFIRARYVPEPSTAALAALGLLLFGGLRRRNHSK